MKPFVPTLLVAALLVGCGDKKPADATAPAAADASAAAAVAAATPASASADGKTPEMLEEERIIRESVARADGNFAELDEEVSAAAAQLTEASLILGADPIAALRGRIEACISGDRQAFASYYVPERANIFRSNPEALGFAFEHECGSGPAPSPAAVDAEFRDLQAYGRRAPQSSRGVGGPKFQVCFTVRGPKACVNSGWENTVEVRDGRVLFSD